MIKALPVKTQIIIGVMFALLIGSYGIFQAKKIISGPSVNIMEPKNGEVLHEALLHVKGIASNVSFITMNDRPVFVDEDGNLAESTLLQNGYNIISIKAIDRFGRKVDRRLEVIYQ